MDVITGQDGRVKVRFGYDGKGVHICGSCQEAVAHGEKYYKIGASYFHKECLLESYDKEELLALLGAVPRRAHRGVACVFIGVYDAEQNK